MIIIYIHSLMENFYDIMIIDNNKPVYADHIYQKEQLEVDVGRIVQEYKDQKRTVAIRKGDNIGELNI